MRALLFISCLGATLFAAAQTQKERYTDTLVPFFVGKWHGEGKYVTGNKLEAELTFSTIDRLWLKEERIDNYPSTYKAISLWGFDETTNEMTDYFFDAPQKHRKFRSAGWKEGKIVFASRIKDNYYQRFSYEKVSDSSFRLIYEASKDSVDWKMGHYLLFSKKSAVQFPEKHRL